MLYSQTALGGAFKVSPVLHSACTLQVRQRPPRVRVQNRAFCLANMQEVWKPVPGYEGLYEVSDQGRVKNAQERILSPNRQTNDYLSVHLYKHGKHTRSPKTIHKLVATVFLTKPEGATEVNHKNFNKQDNRAENLEWTTSRQNVWHTIAAGRNHKPVRSVKGVRIHDGRVVTFESQIAAEDALRGNRTGSISKSIKLGRQAYRYKWEHI